ncbi:MAG: hypothetical protein GEV28_24110 [Actinophytocola sp.]|uniref:tetratricopeptide repeat protein n=1 Tax=Actinophytocola sp. TaxID=1872138 RepID=UPI00132A6789|nr:tetratricopeptide repeat protein [Actinophytocola sp.]MPZ83308.1 hypothetical protein [Actinophytocola sp.]
MTCESPPRSRFRSTQHNHLGVVGRVGDAGGGYRVPGRLDEAATLLEQTATTAERVLGRGHPLTRHLLDAVRRVRKPGPAEHP